MTFKKILISLTTIVSLLMLGSFAFAYTDVQDSYDYKDAINYVTNVGIAQGYDDGSFKPFNILNRAEFTKILVHSKLGKNPLENAKNCFTDVKTEDWFASYVCYAKDSKILSGYQDGSFQPAKEVNLVEAAKIIVNTFEIDTVEVPSSSEWYQVYIDTVGLLNYIPPSFSHLGQPVTRGEMAEIIWRVKEDIQNREGKFSKDLKPGTCQHLNEDLSDNIDINQVRQTWLDWTNQARAGAGLEPYTLNRQLDRTALVWSQVSKDRGYMDHKRPGQSAYYDYWMITDWFANLGLTFQNVNRATHTENIGYGYFNCAETEADCTDAMINSIRSTFNFFMSERGHAYAPHYDSIMKPEFKEIGVGITIDRSRSRYYITIHYGTSITSTPPEICGG